MVLFPTFRRAIQAQDKSAGDRAVASLHNLRMDDAFFLKMFYFIDKAVQVFLASCEKAANRTQVSDEVFESKQHKIDILMHQIPFNMPSQFQDPALSRKGDDEEGSPEKKKAKSRIENPNPVAKLLVPANRFQATYGRNCAEYHNRPTFRNCKMCVTFHLLGYCYRGCPDEASHVKLTSNEEGQAKGYVTKCKA